MSDMSPWVSSHSKTPEGPSEKMANISVAIGDASSVEDQKSEYTTKRGLSSRHIQLIALGGAIGTGLFIGSGTALSQCGPAPLLISYMIMSAFIFVIMNLLTEMVTYLPLPGEATMYAMTRRYMSKTFSFVVGWNLFYALAIIPPAEITACGVVISYWTDLNVAIWMTIFGVCTVAINFLPVKYFGESEFWISTIKLLCITGLIIVGIVIFFGGAPNQHGVQGFRYWRDPGAFVEHLAAGNTGKFLACWTAIIRSGFAFILSPEMITACSSETENPRVNLKKAAGRFAYRLAFFYIGGTLVIGVIVPSNNPNLLGASNASASPFVIGVKLVGIKALDHIVNACIMTSAFSAGNNLFYTASRMLYTMALKGDAPRFFAKCNKWGVPYWSCALTACFVPLAYLNSSDSASTVFTWLSNITTVSGFFEWCFVGMVYLRFRQAITYHGMDDRVPWRPRFQKYGAYGCISFFFILGMTNGYAVFIHGMWSVSDFFACYVTVGFIIALYIIGSILHKDYRIYKPLDEVDVITGLDIVEKEAEEYAANTLPPKNIWEKIYNWAF